MSIKKVSDLDEISSVSDENLLIIVDTTNNKTMKIQAKNLMTALVPSNSGAHNGIYRGADISDLWYDGTISKQIAEGNFSNVFIGDYIIGKNSGRKFIVAEIDPFYGMGDTECKTHHLLIIPELTIGSTQQMNSSNTTTGGYVSSEMRTANMDEAKTIIQNDFTTDNILTYRDYLITTVTSGYPSAGAWTDCNIELMNESMVYGSRLRSPMSAYNGSSVTVIENGTISKSQLSLFRFRPDLVRAKNDSGGRQTWWLRDVVSASYFAGVNYYGLASGYGASDAYGVRPAFPIY